MSLCLLGQYAKRDKKKGRGSGDMITGIRKSIKKESVQKDGQGIISVMLWL